MRPNSAGNAPVSHPITCHSGNRRVRHATGTISSISLRCCRSVMRCRFANCRACASLELQGCHDKSSPHHILPHDLSVARAATAAAIRRTLATAHHWVPASGRFWSQFCATGCSCAQGRKVCTAPAATMRSPIPPEIHSLAIT